MNRIQTVFERNPTLSKPGGRGAWAESLTPLLEELRAALHNRTPQEIARRAGVGWQPGSNAFLIQHLEQRYSISWPQLAACCSDGSTPCDAELQALFLYYLERATGALSEERWVTFRELAGGGFYYRAFEGYTGNPLVQAVADDLDPLRRAASALGGKPIAVGDAGFRFLGLPRIPLALIYWRGDEEFPPKAQVLFDPVASDYLPIDGVAALGRRLVQRILNWVGE
jgi:hypothetical protein